MAHDQTEATEAELLLELVNRYKAQCGEQDIEISRLKVTNRKLVEQVAALTAELETTKIKSAIDNT